MKYAVYLGRFSPLHNGHMSVIRHAEKGYDRVLVIVGSADQSRRVGNPFIVGERARLVGDVVDASKTLTTYINDYPYDDKKWAHTVEDAISAFFPQAAPAHITLLSGNDEWYFRLFPQYKKEIIPKTWSMVTATRIREYWYTNEELKWRQYVPRHVNDYLLDHPLRGELRAEYYACRGQMLEFPGMAVCTDAFVQRDRKILLVTRGERPGKGLLALPGGFLEKNLWLEENMRKELREETGLEVTAIHHSRVFDWPGRSSRNRGITHVYDVSTNGELKAGDDASAAAWYEIDKLDPVAMFEDHYHIIQEMKRK